MTRIAVKPSVPPIPRYCAKHGCLLIRKVYVLVRKDSTNYAADVYERDVSPRCIYESDGCARPR